MGIQRELCPLKDMEQGKVKLIWQDTKKRFHYRESLMKKMQSSLFK